MRLNRIEEARAETRPQPRPPADSQTGPQTTYDVEMLGEVAALAHRLQEGPRELLTAEQIEAAGAEAGLGPTFIQAALRQLVFQRSEEAMRARRRQEFRRLAGGWGVGAAFALLAWLVTAAAPSSTPFLTLLLPLLLAPGLGFLIGKPRAAATTAAALALPLALVFARAGQSGMTSWLSALAYLGAGGPLGAALSWLGATARRRYFPSENEAEAVSAAALLDMLVLTQRQHREHARREACLSLGVSPARETQGSASPELTGPAYEKFWTWASEIVRECGGECEEVAGDELGAFFSTNAAAVSAARRLQERIAQFNVDRNRLSAPFRIRCGIAAGESLAVEEPLAGALRKRLMQQATELQKKADPGDILVSSELAAAALLELRSLAPLPLEAGEEPVFSWRAGQRAQQRP